MKYIAAIIKHFKLDDVKKSLIDAGIQGMTIANVKSFGRQKGHFDMHREAHIEEVNFLPKVKIEIAVPNGKVKDLVNIIMELAKTGEIGDGKIFVYSTLGVVSIRTGEKNEEAIK